MIGSHHTLNIIAICKTILATEPIYRTYCGFYPLSSDFKDFYVFFSLVCDFCHLYLHFYVFFTLYCDFFFHLNLHFSVCFTLYCDFLTPKSTFLCLSFHQFVTFCEFFITNLSLFVTFFHKFVTFFFTSLWLFFHQLVTFCHSFSLVCQFL